MDARLEAIKKMKGSARESQIFHVVGDLLADAANHERASQGMAILLDIVESKVLDDLDTISRSRFIREIKDIQEYLRVAPSENPYERLQAFFKHHGLDVVPTINPPDYPHYLMTAEHDGVPYCMSITSQQSVAPGHIHDALTHYKLAIERHHAIVKGVYEHLKTQNVGDVWVMLGGGSQLQAFFGNHTGYLGILYLTLEDLDEQEELTDNGYLAATGNESYTLQPNFGQNRKWFNGMNVPGVTIRN